MRFKAPSIRIALAVLFILQTIAQPTANAGETLARLKRLITESKYKGTEPCMGQDCAMECLAENIDWLEHHIDTYGSVVAKQPDIWGEARLTKHRDEYERVMFGRLGKFEPTINAAIQQRDSAFLAQALALSAAAGTPTTDTSGDNPSVSVGSVTAVLPGVQDAPTTDWTNFGVATEATEPRITIEPTTYLDQQSRYLKHLHELRRINEGDDTSDSPGYSMNLVRIPVSILPGKLTRKGFGAEITITAEPVISDDLMPTTFRNLVVNDVVHLLGLPLVRVTEYLQSEDYKTRKKKIGEAEQKLEDAEGALAKAEHELESAIAAADAAKSAAVVAQMELDDAAVRERMLKPEQRDALRKLQTAGELAAIDQIRSMEPAERSAAPLSSAIVTPQNQELFKAAVIEERFRAATDALAEAKETQEDASKLVQDRRTDYEALETAVETAKNTRDAAANELEFLSAAVSLTGSSAPAGRARQARNPLNPSSIDDVIGVQNIRTIASFFETAYTGRYIRWSGSKDAEECREHRVNLLDARKFLDAEIQAAYELLSQEDHLCLFAELAEPGSGLAAEIQNGHFRVNGGENDRAVQMYRHYFFSRLHTSHVTDSITDRHGTLPVAIELVQTPHGVPEDRTTDACESSLSQALEAYRSCVPEREPSKECAEAETPVEALAWAIVVESALLNERLNRDVRKLAKAKDAFSLNTTDDHWFFLPDTASNYLPAEGESSNGSSQVPSTCFRIPEEFQSANEVFKEYVRVRWPIHVFAVDPVSQDQNVADASSRRRELQFALALGFQTGQIGANSLTQFSRDLQTQVETISLNRTIVGFGHGNDTFGWRFYPRVQALNAPGTLGVIRETFLGTSRDYDMRRRQIEPGQRECVAVVLMPSFVPYADFDIRTDWFKLTNPKNTALTMKDSLKLSRAITAMRNSRATCAECQHLYRDGELGRLFKRVDQLDRELPLQTQRSMVPYENTLGGFEMFNTGVTDLSPELIGWYGAPGVNTTKNECGCYQGCSQIVKAGCTDKTTCDALATSLNGLNTAITASPLPACQGPGTTLFLVGDNFSVHDTKVIAGGVCIPQVRLISRELMQVTIPHCINTVELCENGKTNKYVAIYIATPYGVTNHLHVPVMSQDGCGDDCSSSVVDNPNAVSIIGSTASVLLSNTHDGGVQQSTFVSTVQPPTIATLETSVNAELLARMTEESELLTSGILNLTNKLDSLEAEVRALTASTNQSLVDVRVSYPDAIGSKADRKWCNSKDFPMLHRFKVKAGEQWRNCRDSLPCN